MADRVYQVYCGNYECRSRLAGETHTVPDSDMEDGVVWLCRSCRPRVVDVAPL
jgi:hypothetical protein